jgi:group I intron endonuclease
MATAIYAIVNNVTRDMYVGSAVAVNRRWNAHRNLLFKQCHYNTRLQRAYNKYGANTFDWEIIQFVDDKTNLISREQFWMDFFKPTYNGRPIANSPLGTKASIETRAKMSVSAKKRGFSDKHKQNISKAKKGVSVMSEAQKAHLSNVNKGKVFSAETREKIRTTSTGRYHTDEAKQKISVAAKARWAAKKGQ